MRYPSDPLTRLVMECHFTVVQLVNCKVLAPRVEHLRGSTVIETAVHFATTTHASAFDIGDFGRSHTDSDTAIPIFLDNLIAREMRRGVERKIRTFLDEENIETGFGKKGSSDSAARTRADDHYLRPQPVTVS
jgi:hypothetical protein